MANNSAALMPKIVCQQAFLQHYALYVNSIAFPKSSYSIDNVTQPIG